MRTRVGLRKMGAASKAIDAHHAGRLAPLSIK
jgi:hypothetical protein